jgi:hypothetical protein
MRVFVKEGENGTIIMHRGKKSKAKEERKRNASREKKEAQSCCIVSKCRALV